MVPKHVLPAFKEKKKNVWWSSDQHCKKQAGKDNAHTGSSANKKMWKRAPKKLAILKLLQIYFKAKHEKGVATPFPRVPAPLHLWCTHPLATVLKCEMSTHSAGGKDVCGTMWLFLMSTHLVDPCAPHLVGTPLGNSGTHWGVRYTRLTSTALQNRRCHKASSTSITKKVICSLAVVLLS